MQRTTMFLLGALLAAGVVVVWFVWFSPRGYTIYHS